MFSKSKTAPDDVSSAPAHRANGATFSVICADVVITGNISATVDLHIDGRVDGDIQCAALVQGEGSRIAGAIAADSARIAGTLEGSINAKELVIERTAQVTGDVSYERITIEAGGHVEGRFTLRGGALLASEADVPLQLVNAVAD